MTLPLYLKAGCMSGGDAKLGHLDEGLAICAGAALHSNN